VLAIAVSYKFKLPTHIQEPLVTGRRSYLQRDLNKKRLVAVTELGDWPWQSSRGAERYERGGVECGQQKQRCYFWRDATAVFFSVVKIWCLFAGVEWIRVEFTSQIQKCVNTYTISEDYVRIRWTPPVSCKKFHLPLRANQGRRGIKDDRVRALTFRNTSCARKLCMR